MSGELSRLARVTDGFAFGRRLAAHGRAGRSFTVGGMRSAARPLLLALLSRHLALPALWVTPTLEGAERLYEDAAAFLEALEPEEDADGRFERSARASRGPRVGLFPERETSRFDVGASDPERLLVLQALAAGEPLFVVAPVLSVVQQTVAPRVVTEAGAILRRGADLELETLLAALVGCGYERVPMVELRGQFSLRGGILDVFPSTGEPVRAELFGDTVDELRTFDLDTQRSVAAVDCVAVLPMHEGEGSAHLTAYLPERAFVVLEEPARLKLRTEEWAEEQGGSAGDVTWQAVTSLLGDRPRVELTSWGATEATADVFLKCEPVAQFSSQLETFAQNAAERAAAAEMVVVVTHQAPRVEEILKRVDAPVGELAPGRIHVAAGHLSEGFHLFGDDGDPAVSVITDRELLGVSRRRRYFRTAERGSLLRLEDLKRGDAVVHTQHGIGRFDGLTTLDIEGQSRDFLKLIYARGDSLFVPVEQMDMIGKYVGVEGAAPVLSRLGRAEWQKTRARVSEQVREMAEMLLRLYAERQAGEGHAYPPDTPWQDELEAAFPFEETRDQQKAIDRVKDDMEQPAPMDRLVCGDVGYGKTEVAVRAAFKAVMDGRQVAVLVPTTVLAQQHFQTFRERMGPFPVRIEVLSRFRTAGEQRAVVAGLQEGTVDVVIGTHRLLQKDTKFKNLGLIVVDEEQHFGVAHKERLKELRATVDILTMTATPIPRTLQMSLMGIRDLSLIETPPMHRLPIKTYLFEASPEVMKGAILRELERDGQVFVVHNRVQGIEKVAADIRRLVPGARVIVGHGQMAEDALEQVMLEFVEGEHDILVCTTIIESGLDIPTVNTIIINNAHRFGLGQLYQLRGRVGRAHHQAYCYLLYPPDRSLTPEAEMRLDTIREFTALGSGYQIALRDLEIRGAGDLLGAEQSGRIADVGFDLYCQMLEEAVSQLKGEPRKRKVTDAGPVVDLPVEAHLGDDYVSDSRQKITLYRRLADIEDNAAVDAMREELRDRFGPLPPAAETLVKMVRLKVRCLELGVPSIKFRKSVVERSIALVLPFVQTLPYRSLQRLQSAAGVRAEFSDYVLTLTDLPAQADWPELVLRVLDRVRDAVG